VPQTPAGTPGTPANPPPQGQPATPTPAPEPKPQPTQTETYVGPPGILIACMGCRLGDLFTRTPLPVAGIEALGKALYNTMDALTQPMQTALSWALSVSQEAKEHENKSQEVKDGDKKPTLESNPKHHPNSDSPEPGNVKELYDQSIPDKNGVRWTKDENGEMNRFSKPSNGKTHWNGTTDPSNPNPIQPQNIPNPIKQHWGY
jgi:hypothetical protein